MISGSARDWSMLDDFSVGLLCSYGSTARNRGPAIVTLPEVKGEESARSLTTNLRTHDQPTHLGRQAGSKESSRQQCRSDTRSSSSTAGGEYRNAAHHGPPCTHHSGHGGGQRGSRRRRRRWRSTSVVIIIDTDGSEQQQERAARLLACQSWCCSTYPRLVRHSRPFGAVARSRAAAAPAAGGR